jgi:predicted AAA+ superfamily ATPase
LHLNFFDDRLFGLQQGNLDLILEAYHSLYPGRPAAEPVYCFFDEIQMLTGWEPFVERLLRSGNHRVWLTGSSARMLSTELATQMRGRALSWELFPLSFRELLAGNGLQAEGAL